MKPSVKWRFRACLVLLACVLFASTYQSTANAHFHQPDQPCSSSDYLFLGGKWPNAVYTYYTELDAYWPGGQAGRWQALYGHLNWNNTSNSCGQPDISPFAGWWGGGVSGYTPGVFEGVNFRDMGPLANIGCGGAVACAPTRIVGGIITEADIRFEIFPPKSNGWWWGAGSQGARYDIQSVAAHEAGHSLGLADLYHHYERYLTLYGAAYFDKTQRTLGWGDYTGMQALYP